jgi:hypothetical protein
MTTLLIESVCFHPDNALVVRALGALVAVVALAGLGWLFRDAFRGVSLPWGRVGLGAGWIAVMAAAFLLVTRSGVRVTVDHARQIVRQDASIAGVTQTREFPVSAFRSVAVTFDYAEWETWGSTRSTSSGRSTKHVSPVNVWKVILAGAEPVDIERFHAVRAAERRAVALARLLGLRAERHGYRVGRMTGEELRDFREVRSRFVGPRESGDRTDGLAVGTLRIRAVQGETQPLSLDDWPDDETRTIPILVPARR